jgi:hypothetical protein
MNAPVKLTMKENFTIEKLEELSRQEILIVDFGKEGKLLAPSGDVIWRCIPTQEVLGYLEIKNDSVIIPIYVGVSDGHVENTTRSLVREVVLNLIELDALARSRSGTEEYDPVLFCVQIRGAEVELSYVSNFVNASWECSAAKTEDGQWHVF